MQSVLWRTALFPSQWRSHFGFNRIGQEGVARSPWQCAGFFIRIRIIVLVLFILLFGVIPAVVFVCTSAAVGDSTFFPPGVPLGRIGRFRRIGHDKRIACRCAPTPARAGIECQ